MEQISISEIQRNLHKLDNFDIVEVIDRKRDKVKGYFIDSKYASFIADMLTRERENRDRTSSLAGSLHRYADKEKQQTEEDAWKKHVEEMYRS